MQDQHHVAACRALSDATRARRQWTRQSLKTATRRYEQALGYWQAVDDRSQEAATLKNIGEVCEILSEQQKAVTSFRKARALYRELKDQTGEVQALNSLSASYVYRGQFQKALEIHAQEGVEGRTIDDDWERAHTLHNLGAAYYGTNEMPTAIGFLNDALRVRRALGDRSGQSETLLYLGFVHHAIKETREAEEYYRKSLDSSRAAKNPRGEALALIALGHLSNIKGERQQALDYYDQSMKIFQTIGELVGQCSVLQGVAYLYSAMGEKQKALDCYLEVLGLARRVQDAEAEGNTLDSISEIYRELGDLSSALQYSQQAVLVNRSMPSILGESYALANLGKVLEAQGNRNGAIESYSRALDLSRKGGDRFLEGLLLNAIGQLHHRAGQVSKALDYYQQASALQQRTNDSVRLPSTLYNLARIQRDLGNLEGALSHAKEALEITDSLRGKVASRELRASFLATAHQQYELTIDLQMQLHRARPSERFDAAGLHASERARARSLLESLSEARADIRQGVEPALLERERSLQQLLSAKTDGQMRLLGGTPKKEEADAIAKEIRDLTTEYEQVQGEIRSKSPRYAELTQSQPLGLNEIQQQVLDDQTLLLEYSLGDERSYLWAVTHTTITSHELPSRAEIEKPSRRVYQLLTARQPQAGDTPNKLQARVTEAEAQYWQQAGALSEILLGPVAGQLGTKRLLIVAEGALQYLPFGALPVPGIETGPPVPLIVNHEIVSLPSASVLAVLRRETVQPNAATRAVAVLADPVFETDDPRLLPGRPRTTRPPPSNPSIAAARRRPAPTSDLHRALRDVGILRNGLGIPRLPSSRIEADAILAITPDGTGMKATDFQANRVTATSPELGQYRIVHFATHGLFNSEHPELSGIVLSLVDERGKPQDGFLRLHDIYNLNLPVDLVVLSACNTGLGKDVKGEGLVGIVRGFMYAGAARVVASLWKVDDEATAELMKRFYQQILREGQSPAAALRAAQKAMWQHKRWRSPYYWAAFGLQGEWKGWAVNPN